MEPDEKELPPAGDVVTDSSLSLDGPEDWTGSLPIPPPP